MNTRMMIVAGCVVVGGAIAAVVSTRINKPEIPVPALVPPEPAVTSTPATQPAVALAEPEPAAPEVAAPAPTPTPVVQTPANQPDPKQSKQAAKPSVKNKQRPGQAGAPALAGADPDKPVTRQALSLVGADPDAEAFWVQSINDPTISAHDRSDLIEDLNEEGFDDPKNLTPDDLPLIVNRLAIIENLAPDSMDEVNAAAFAEAYKDLTNMYVRVSGQ